MFSKKIISKHLKIAPEKHEKNFFFNYYFFIKFLFLITITIFITLEYKIIVK
jgi:hypothetical protein